MNIAEFKRKALGFVLREEGDDSPSGGGPIGSERGASYNPVGIGSGPSESGDTPTGGWSNGGSGVDPAEGGRGGGPIGSESGANYNAPQDIDTPKEAKSQGALVDFFTPSEGSLAYRLGLRAPGTTAEQMFNSETAAEKEDRMGLVNSGLQKAANFAMSSVPGGGVLMGLKNAAQSHENGASWGDAISSAAKGILGGIVSSRINSEIGKALGPDVSAALNGYNKVASVANLASTGSLPSINPGGAITQAVIGPTAAQPNQSVIQGGDTSPDGTQLPVGGWSSGSGGGSSGKSTSTDEELLPATATSIKANAYKKNGLYSAYF
jgi:hypothetical protein